MLLREDKKKLVGIGIVCLVAAGVILCLAFIRDGKRLFSIDAKEVAAIELGYQMEDQGPLLRIEDRETVKTLVEYLNRYQYQGAKDPDPFSLRSGGNLPGIWLLNKEDLVITNAFVRANGVTKSNVFYYCTDNYFQPLLDLILTKSAE